MSAKWGSKHMHDIGCDNQPVDFRMYMMVPTLVCLLVDSQPIEMSTFIDPIPCKEILFIALTWASQ
jgi:hypothetical protein